MHVGFVVVFARVSSIGFTAKTRVIYLKGIEKCSSAAHKAVRLLWKQDLVTIFRYYNNILHKKHCQMLERVSFL